MFNLLRNKSGLGLVEVLMAAGIAGGIALTVAKLSQDANRVTKTTETNNEINMFMTDAAYILSDKDNCQNSIIGALPPATVPANGTAVAAIRRKGPAPAFTPVVVYQTGQVYGNRLFTIDSMVTEHDGTNTNLRVTLSRNNAVTNGAKTIVKKIPLKAVVSGGNISSCFSDTEDMIEDAARAACHGNSARWDAGAKECHHDILISPATCPDGQALRLITTGTPGLGDSATFTCEAVSTTACPAGQYQTGFNATGAPACASLPCGANQLIKKTGTDSFSCINVPATPCGPNQVLKEESGSFVCKDAYCPANQYLRGFNSTGNMDCRALPTGTCPTDQYVTQVNPDGSVNCAPVPAGATLPQVDYSFVDGYNGGVWSRKSITQTAQQICARITGFTWDGTNCNPTAAGTTDFAAICAKFPGHEWTGTTCRSATSFNKLISFQLRFNGTSWSVGGTKIIYSDTANDRNVPVVIFSATQGSNRGRFNFRIHHNNYYMDSAEVIVAQLIGPRGPQADGNKNMKLSVTDISGNNEIELVKADDATDNDFQPGDIVNIIWGNPRM